MDIYPLGHASFRIRGKGATIVTDPYSSDMVGLKFPKNIEADVVTVSHDHNDHNAVSAISGDAFVVGGPGEYEMKGVHIRGISSFHDGEGGAKRGKNTIYHIEIDSLRLAHLGDLGHTLSSGDVEQIGEVDILFIPVGGTFTIDAKAAAQIVHDIEPSIVIPMHYQRTGLNPQAFGDLSPVRDFLKEMGKEETIFQSKLSVTKDKIPEELQVVVLE
ncbi:MBL fold metallo-hydrolase [Candidatus Gottesmanbacteria bacterium]|nr:MBL fold metallo-hydrolase [Candidatus Gottesmanbacteria bacterium]